MMPDWDALEVGQDLPLLVLPPLTRLTLALYCGASGDHNPIHVDSDFARAAGMGDVFAHGMLSAAWLARVLTGWAPQSALRSLDVRFAALTRVGERITCTGRVTAKESGDAGRTVRVELATVDADGIVKLTGQATIAWP